MSLTTHTHCQVAEKPAAQSKTCQRVYLPDTKNEMENKKTAYNNLYSA